VLLSVRVVGMSTGAGTGTHRRRSVRVVRWIGIGLVVLVAGIAASALTGGSPAAACGTGVERGVLPEWARAGFSEREPRIAHVIGRNGELAAILFADPLVAPARPDGPANKILWVAKRTPPPGPLELTAEQEGRTEERTVESGPGPSSVDLPAGCWQVKARWPGGEDELDLTYVAR